VDIIVDTLLAQMHLRDRRVALLVNGLGGTPPIELAIVARHAFAVLRARGFRVERAWCGNFMTALEMPGCSLSLLAVDDARLNRLDAPATAPAWPGGGRVGERRLIVTAAPGSASDVAIATEASPLGAALRRAALAAADAFERAEAELTNLDSRVGDGDLGISMVRGAAAIRGLSEDAWRTPAGALAAMAHALRRAIGGSSGPFYATALLRAARIVGAGPVTAESWARAFAAAVWSIAELGGAKRGDRTMLDALAPASDAFGAAVAEGLHMDTAWARAVAAAEEGAAATAAMHPRLGRAAYQGSRAIGTPDAGAMAVLVWIRAIAGAPG
jgi:dihydroxyacetone kinase